MGTYLIAEVAERTGFPPSTLRWYEEVGVVPPPARTPAGYRTYDDRAVERLRFVARAKQLGCTLEEIAGLASVWERDDCAPVQQRLRDLVATKLAEVDERMAELRAFETDLRLAASSLAGSPLDGSCDGTCGCMAEPVVACTLEQDELPGRMALIERLGAEALSVERTGTGLVLRFPRRAEVEAEVRRFAEDERRCCPFWRFAVEAHGGELVLRWHGPPAAGELLDQLEAVLRARRDAGPAQRGGGLRS